MSHSVPPVLRFEFDLAAHRVGISGNPEGNRGHPQIAIDEPAHARLIPLRPFPDLAIRRHLDHPPITRGVVQRVFDHLRRLSRYDHFFYCFCHHKPLALLNVSISGGLAAISSAVFRNRYTRELTRWVTSEIFPVASFSTRSRVSPSAIISVRL